MERSFGVGSQQRVHPGAGSRARAVTQPRHLGFSAKAAQRANGANVLHLSPRALLDLPIVILEMRVQQSFDRLVAPLLANGDVLAQAELRLVASRDLLLPRLISGDLSVIAAEAEMEAAA